MFFLLPLIGAAVGATIGAIIADDWAESDRAEARHHRDMENALTSKYSSLQSKYNEIADESKALAEEQNKKLAQLALDNAHLDIALELSCSLVKLSQDISINPTHESLSKLQEAIRQTNQVLFELDKQPIPISGRYFTNNLAAIEKKKLAGKTKEKVEISEKSGIDLSVLANKNLTKYEKIIVTQVYELVISAMDYKVVSLPMPRLDGYQTNIVIDIIEEIGERLSNHAMPEFVFEQLSEEQPHIRLLIARHIFTPSHTLDKLSLDSQALTREAVANNSSCPSYILDKLSSDPELSVRLAVLANTKTPLSTRLKVLVNNKKQVDLSLRKSLAVDSSLTSENLAQLSQDISPEVRKLVAIHPNTSLEILEKLSKDSDFSVRKAVITNPQYCIDTGNIHNIDLCKTQLKFRKDLAANALTKSEVLAKLSSDRSSEVRKLVAQHPNTARDILEKLAKSKNMEIKAAAKNSLHQRHLQ